jgi:hypothetical protein
MLWIWLRNPFVHAGLSATYDIVGTMGCLLLEGFGAENISDLA